MSASNRGIRPLGLRVLWLGRPLRFGLWRGFWQGEGRKFHWMIDLGPVRVTRRRSGV